MKKLTGVKLTVTHNHIYIHVERYVLGIRMCLFQSDHVLFISRNNLLIGRNNSENISNASHRSTQCVLHISLDTCTPPGGKKQHNRAQLCAKNSHKRAKLRGLQNAIYS